MKRFGHVYRFFLLISCTALCAACFSPIGSIGGSAGAADLFWIVPKRVAYEVSEWLERDDLQVFTSYRGVVESINPEEVKIGVVEDPVKTPDVLVDFPVEDLGYALKSAGRKLVVVKYEDNEASYSIEVQDPFGIGIGNGTGPGTGPGIVIEWEEPVNLK